MTSGPPTPRGATRARLDRPAAAVAAAVAVLILAVIGYAVLDREEPPAGDPTVREYPAGQRPPLPPISGETLDGSHLDLADLRGDVLVINVWASWCPPCRAETDDLEAVHQATRDQQVSFVGINVEDQRDKATSFLAGRVTYPSIFDPGSRYARGFTDPPAPVGLPGTLVVDRDGGIAAAIYRPVGREELEAIVTRLAAEDPADG
ncbi:MAG TPA: TlpA disulfide reductase family protein [Natronosporangium sp.]|nr:TlpA disulfide reductase family protein [Natronosporangium sp.]